MAVTARSLAAAFVVLGFAAFHAPAQSSWFDTLDEADQRQPESERTRNPHCQILDFTSEPACRAGLAYVTESAFEDYGESGVVEMDTRWQLAYFFGILYGDIDLSALLEADFYLDESELLLPDQLVALAVEAGWTWRFRDGLGLRLAAAPGLYSDLEAWGEALFVPYSVCAVKAFDSRLSGKLGFSHRPGFERPFMPVIGLAWDLPRRMRLELGLPDSRLTLYWARDWTTYAGVEWESTSYAIGDKGDFDREMVTQEDFRAFAGLTFRATAELHFSVEGGLLFNRDVEFSEDAPGVQENIDVDDALFLRFGLTGPY